MPKAAYEDWGPGCSELSSLKSATDKALLDNTEERYKAGNIYTRSGRLLLAVNPYKKLPLYTDETLQAYKSSLAPQARGAPHRQSLWARGSDSLRGCRDRWSCRPTSTRSLLRRTRACCKTR